jgi:hypothetical protein
LEDFLGSAFGSDWNEEVASTIEIGQWRGAGLVGLHADTNGLRPIIFALIEFTAAMVTYAGDFGRACCDVKNRFAIGAGASSAQPVNNLLEGKFVTEDGIELEVVFVEQFIERLSLGHCSWKAVQEKASLAAETADAFGNQCQHGAVRNQLAAAHELDGGRECGSEFA